jgi:hypothetical protein
LGPPPSAAVLATLRRLAPELGAGVSYALWDRADLWAAFTAGAQVFPVPPLVVGYHYGRCASSALHAPRYGGRLAFGFGLAPLCFMGRPYWLAHTWLVDAAGGVVECTAVPRQAYVGAILPAALAQTFTRQVQAEALNSALKGRHEH